MEADGQTEVNGDRWKQMSHGFLESHAHLLCDVIIVEIFMSNPISPSISVITPPFHGHHSQRLRVAICFQTLLQSSLLKTEVSDSSLDLCSSFTYFLYDSDTFLSR